MSPGETPTSPDPAPEQDDEEEKREREFEAREKEYAERAEAQERAAAELEARQAEVEERATAQKAERDRLDKSNKDAQERLALLERAEEARVKREAALKGQEEEVRKQREAADATAAEAKATLDAAEKALARSKGPAEAPAAPAATAPGAPPAAAGGRSGPDRWKGIAQEDRVDIPESSSMAADVEFMFSQGYLPRQVIEQLGLPANRYTHDQLRKFYLRQRNTAPGPGGGPAVATSSLEDELKKIKQLRELGVVFTKDDLDKAIDKALERFGGNRGGGGGGTGDESLDGLDDESRSNVLVAREVRALGMEIVDTVRSVTGHPKIGSSVAEELRLRRGARDTTQIPTRQRPELPPGAQRSPEPILAPALPPGGGAPAPTGPPMPQASIEGEHPEFWPALDRIVELAPRVYEFIAQRSSGIPKNQVIENVQRDATLGAVAAWRLASKSKPGHDWVADGTCARCKAQKTADSIGKVCTKGLSQKDMLRRLYGLSVSSLIELVGRYQGALEFTSSVDALGGMSVQEFMMRKRWGNGDRIDLGNGTIYGTVLQTDEGLTWLGTFLAKLKEEIDKNPETEQRREEGGQEKKQAPTGPPPAGPGAYAGMQGPAGPDPIAGPDGVVRVPAVTTDMPGGG